MEYKILDYFKDTYDVLEKEEASFKRILQYEMKERDKISLNFLGVEAINESIYYGILEDFLSDVKILSKIEIKGASNGVKRSLYKIINRKE